MNKPLVLKIHGMDCAEEVSMLKRELVPLVGEEALAFDVLNAKLLVDLQDVEVTRDEILAAIRRTGLIAEQYRNDPGDLRQRSVWQRIQRGMLTSTSGVFAAMGIISQVASSEWSDRDHLSPITIVFYVIAIFAGLYPVIHKAWRSAIALRPDMNLLMTVAIVGAMLIGEWFEGATVAFLFSLSLLLESWSVGRARRAVSTLKDLVPVTARIRDESGVTREVSPDEVDVGTNFVVRPGENIPLDGIVRMGASTVNQAPITGESQPIDKQSGSEVYAGTINGDGLLEVESTKPADDTTLAKIVRMVLEAQSKRSKSEQWVEKFARYYTPLVMVAAILVLLVPPLLLAGDWSSWFYRSLVLLVIACPCALVISTPISIVASLAAAARNGVLIKGGLYAEIPARLRAIAMDKTGTLTNGNPQVVDVMPLDNRGPTELIQRAAALESNSNHPLAQAIVRYAQKKKIDVPIVTQFSIVQGKGARGKINGESFWLGSQRLLKDLNLETQGIKIRLKSLQSAGRSIVIVGNDQHVCGIISLADTVRNTARDVVDQLHLAGIKSVVMLTGDNQSTADAIAADVGIDRVYAELLPEDKVKIIEQLVDQFENVAMVGDGINDAPALARSSLGIAMGAIGSDAAIETADIALMSDDLSRLPWLIKHSRRTLSVIRQNVWCALAIKLIFALLAFTGLSTLWAAIAADMGASLLVIFNSLRLFNERSLQD